MKEDAGARDESLSPQDAFLEAYWADRDSGDVKPLVDYLKRFPGADLAIAAEYVALQKGAPGREEDGLPALGLPLDRDEDRIGPYRLVRELGRGGQGEVHLAEDTRLGRKVALKVLTNLGPVSETMIGRFRREAEVASRLDHPGICTIFEAGNAQGIPFIAMRFVEGETLARKIQLTHEESLDNPTAIDLKQPSSRIPGARSAPPSVEPPSGRGRVIEVVGLFERVARALHFAHTSGVIHRDIKPGNIIVTPEGEPVILDFGLARELEGDVKTLTLSGDLFGTPAYMSPEQLTENARAVDARTDVHSLGVTLFECLTLERPFDGPSREKTFQNILTREPPDSTTLNPSIPSDLKIVLDIAMEKDRNHRYQSALALAEDLGRVRRCEPIQARPVSTFFRFRRWVQRNPALASALIGIFLVLAAGLTTSLVLLSQKKTALDQSQKNEKNALSSRKRLQEQLALSRGYELSIQASEVNRRDPGLALLLAMEAARRAPGEFTDRALLDSLEALREIRTLAGHPATVEEAAFNATGTRILTRAADGRSRLWDARTGKRLEVFEGAWRFNALDAPEKKPVAFEVRTREDGTVFLQEQDRCMALPGSAGRKVNSVTLDSRGRRIALVGKNHTLHLLDADSGGEIALLVEKAGSVKAVAFSPDGRRLFAAVDGVGCTWRAETGILLNTLGARDATVESGTWSPGSGWIATARTNFVVVLHDAEKGWERIRFRGHLAPITHVGFSGQGGRLVTTSEDRTARVWDIEGGRKICELRGHRDRVTFAAFTADGQRVVTTSADGTARIWNVAPSNMARTLETDREAAELAGFGPDGRTLVLPSAENRNVCHRVQCASGRVLTTFTGHTGPVLFTRFSATGKHLLTTSEDRTVRIWEADTGREVTRVEMPGKSAFFAGLDPHGRNLVTLSVDSALLWTTTDPGRPTVLKGHRDTVTHAEFSPDGQLLVTASDDGTARVHEARTGQEIAACIGHGACVWPARFDRRGVRILTASSDRTARIWSARSGKIEATLTGHRALVFDARFDPAGERVLTLSEDNTAALWDARTGKRIFTLEHPEGVGAGGAFSPDGRLVATTSGSMVLLWDARTGKRRAVLERENKVCPVACLRFSPDSRCLVSLAGDGSLRTWFTRPLEEAESRAPRTLTGAEKARFEIEDPN